MDYLRKNCRNDHEKMQMVALKFGMYRDLARVKEEQALRDMKRLKHRSLGMEETGEGKGRGKGRVCSGATVVIFCFFFRLRQYSVPEKNLYRSQ